MPKKLNREETLKQIEEHYTIACDLALQLVEQEARKILRRRKSLHKFVMGMGTWHFSGKDNEDYYQSIYDESDAFTGPVADIIGEWDQVLKITGEALMFTAEGSNEFDR